MRKVIYKYLLQATMHLPYFFTVMHFGRDPQDDLCIWAIVDPEDTNYKKYKCYQVSTGETLPFDSNSTLMLGTERVGKEMWHYFLEG